MSTHAVSIRNSLLDKVFYLILASPVLFLLANKYPYFLVLSILIIVFLSLIFFLYARKVTSYHYPVLLVLSAIYVYFIISYFLSGQYLSNFLSYSFIRMDGNFFFCYILFFAFATPFFNYKKLSDYYFKIIFFVFSLFALIGMIEFIAGISSYMLQGTTDRGTMFVGLNVAHNATGSIYALASVFALIFFLEEKLKKMKILYALIFLLCAVGLYLTKSMGSYIAFVAAAVFVLWLHFKSAKKFFITIAAMLAVSVPILWATHLYERLLNMFSVESTAFARLELWNKAWQLFSRSPLTGIGFARYNDTFSLLHESLAGFKGIVAVYLLPQFYYGTNHAHNSYLHFLAETGLIGLVLIIFFWCLCFYIIFKAFKSSEDNLSRKVFLGGLSAIILLFVLSLTENYMSATIIMIGSSMIVSLCIGLAWQERNIKETI